MDTHTPDARRKNMQRIRSRDTGPEMLVRRLLHAAGYRFRVHVRSLPGTPDVVFPARRSLLFVHGCFWHQHPNCPRATKPSTNAQFWHDKLQRNVVRDGDQLARLQYDGWRVLTVWECETADRDALLARLSEFLGPPRSARTSARPSR
jgi:DNA mismatch endonuclease (patch repair protein)